MSIDLIIRGATCVSHQGIMQMDIAIRDGIIVAMGQLPEIDGAEVIDATGLHILPGVIDTDFHAPENAITECMAVIKGGVTSVLITTESDVSLNDQLPIDYAYFNTVGVDDVDDISAIEMADGCAGIHIVMGSASNYNVISDDKTLLHILKRASRRVSIHSEDQERLNERMHLITRGDVSSHLIWRDERVAIKATRRILAIARGAGRPVHLRHVSSDKEMALIAAYKDVATVAVSPHHLSLSAPECYDHFHSYAQIDPPIRSEENRIGLWKAVSGGIVDVLSSQHMPQPVLQKDQPYPNSPSGCPSVQSMLPLMLDQVNQGSLSLLTLMDLTSAGPARVFNIANKGRIAVGYDADFTFVDLNKEWTLDDDDVLSSCGWDLHAGCTFKGQVTGAMTRGVFAMWDGVTTGEVKGAPVKFYDAFKEYEDE